VAPFCRGYGTGKTCRACTNNGHGFGCLCGFYDNTGFFTGPWVNKATGWLAIKYMVKTGLIAADAGAEVGLFVYEPRHKYDDGATENDEHNAWDNAMDNETFDPADRYALTYLYDYLVYCDKIICKMTNQLHQLFYKHYWLYVVQHRLI
jgi:hypothetical protein